MTVRPKVVALMAAHNEEDVIGPVIEDLGAQGAAVYLLDHGSTDGTVAEAERFRGRGLLEVERLDLEGFSITAIVRRKEELAATMEADWVVNADADEFRESPWPGVGFVEALGEVDRLGYNAVDFAVLNFRPVDDGFRKGTDPRAYFRFYEPGAVYDRLQIRCWKKRPGPLDLVSTAGHEARFEGRSVFPLRFLLRHYPVRSQAHGERKVFRERKPRFSPQERARGWHVQYDAVEEGHSFLREPSSLRPWDPFAARVEVAIGHRLYEQAAAELAAARQDLQQLGAEVAAARAQTGELQALRAHTATLDRELAAAGERVAGLQAQHAELAAALRMAGESLAAQRREGEARSHEYEAWRAESEARRAALDGELAGVRLRLQAVLDSRIWRGTAPLRRLLDRVLS